MINFDMKNVSKKLNQGKVIVYPTESVFGLGCNPDNENAICTLLSIKKRSWKKGLILIAANYMQLIKYIDDRYLSNNQKLRVFSAYSRPITWLLPAKSNAPYWLTGQFSSIAVRISKFEPVKRLCLSFGKPLISTSANISGYPPAYTIKEVYSQFEKHDLIVIHKNVLGFPNPSIIQDAITGKIIRK